MKKFIKTGALTAAVMLTGILDRGGFSRFFSYR